MAGRGRHTSGQNKLPEGATAAMSRPWTKTYGDRLLWSQKYQQLPRDARVSGDRHYNRLITAAQGHFTTREETAEHVC